MAFGFCFRRMIYAARVRLLTPGVYIGFPPVATMHHRYTLNVSRHLAESEILFIRDGHCYFNVQTYRSHIAMYDIIFDIQGILASSLNCVILDCSAVKYVK